MSREVFMFIMHGISIIGLMSIVDYKRPLELRIINWSVKEKIIFFIIAVILISILKTH